MDELRKLIRALTNENNGLKQILPRLQNKQGDDILAEVSVGLAIVRNLIDSLPNCSSRGWETS